MAKIVRLNLLCLVSLGLFFFSSCTDHRMRRLETLDKKEKKYETKLAKVRAKEKAITAKLRKKGVNPDTYTYKKGPVEMGSKPSTKKPKDNSSSTTPSENPSVSGAAGKALKTALSYVGTKYKYGGMDKRGMDCSGLMYTSYKSAGITLPRVSKEQSNVGQRIYIGQLKPGDLIFFGASPGSKKITHVGMVSYSKNGDVKFIHSSTSRGVVEDELTEAYWKPRYIKASRPAS